MEPIERIRMCRILEKMEQLPECSKRLGIRDTSYEASSIGSFQDLSVYRELDRKTGNSYSEI